MTEVKFCKLERNNPFQAFATVLGYLPELDGEALVGQDFTDMN